MIGMLGGFVLIFAAAMPCRSKNRRWCRNRRRAGTGVVALGLRPVASRALFDRRPRGPENSARPKAYLCCNNFSFR